MVAAVCSLLEVHGQWVIPVAVTLVIVAFILLLDCLVLDGDWLAGKRAESPPCGYCDPPTSDDPECICDTCWERFQGRYDV